MQIKRRKLDHLEICANSPVEIGSTWLEDATLVHDALPELDLADIDTSTEFLGKRLRAPLVVAAITGGVEEAGEINKSLAKAAERLGIGFGMGSQRAMIEHPETWETFYVRDVAPTAMVLGNIGLVNAREIGAEKIEEAFRKVKADFMCVHMNAAQEAVQPEGDTGFSGCLGQLSLLSKRMPVIAKEVGNGVSRESAMALKGAGAVAIDVGGYGGTSWIKVEEYRGKGKSAFTEWGIPTAASITECAPGGLPIIATGGIRNGLDCAKAIALGASLCGMALPCLKWHYEGVLEERLEQAIRELRVAMLLSGSASVARLKSANVVVSGRLGEWCSRRGLETGGLASGRGK